MLSFNQYISESKSAPLYHGTAFDNVKLILKAGKIEASENGRTSTARDINTLRRSYASECYFVLDQLKLSHNYKITPTDWYAGGSVVDTDDEDWTRDDPEMRRSESEESIKGDIPMKYVKELVVNKRKWDTFTRPKDQHEIDMENDLKQDPTLAPLLQGMLYKDRMKRVAEFKQLLRKYPHIKLTIKQY